MALTAMAEGGAWVRRKRPEQHFIINEKDYARHMSTPPGFIDVYVVGPDNIKRVLSDGWMLLEKDPRIEVPEDQDANVKAILDTLTANQFETLRQAFFAPAAAAPVSAPVAEATVLSPELDPELAEATVRARLQGIHENNDAARKSFGKPAANRPAHR